MTLHGHTELDSCDKELINGGDGGDSDAVNDVGDCGISIKM